MSKYIFGMHDYHPDLSSILREKNKTAWVVHTTAIGYNPNDRNGGNFQNDRTTAVVRLNNGYGSTGTIPLPHEYDDFASRCANFVANSQGIEYVVIGNEIALKWEHKDGIPLTLANYNECYKKCYQKIKSVAPQVKVAPQAVAPWNIEVPDAPDWIDQFSRMINEVPLDWIALHAYTRGYDHNSFHTGAKMNPPWDKHYSNWETLYEFMAAIPTALRHLPVLITEVNGDGSWPDHNSNWVQKLYSVINDWNSKPDNQKILCAALFRWQRDDEKWDISRHGGSVDDFKQALNNEYLHNYTGAKPVIEVKKFHVGQEIYVDAEAGLNLRQKPNGDIIERLPHNSILTVVQDEGGEWVQVNTISRLGWVHKNYVKIAS